MPLDLPQPKSDGSSSRERAQRWLDTHPTFEASYSDSDVMLQPASKFAPSLYQNGAFGISFSRPIQSNDTASSLQDALQFVCPQPIALPGLERSSSPSEDDWDVKGCFPSSHVYSGTDDQTISIDAFDGTTLRCTLINVRLYCITGKSKTVSQSLQRMADVSLPEGSYWQIRHDFRGTLHYEYDVKLDTET